MATCVENMSCFPETPAEIFMLWEHQYNIPTEIILGLFTGMIILAIYVRTRSIAHLAVMGIYAISIFSAMWASDAFLEEQTRTALYVIAVAIATVIVAMVLKLVKE